MVLHEATLAWENNSKLCLLGYKFIHSSTVSHLFVRSFIQPATRSFLHSSTHSPNSYRAAASCQMLCLVLGRKRCASPASAHPNAQAGLRNGPRLRQGVRLAVPSETTFRSLGALQNGAASRGPDGCLRLCSRSTALAAEFRG